MSRYIDADALIMALRLEYPMMPMFKENQEEWGIKTEGYRKAEEVIKDAPTIEPKRGKWKEYDTGGESNVYECSVCGEPWELNAGTPQDNNMNFCPNCGADMRGKDDDIFIR